MFSRPTHRLRVISVLFAALGPLAAAAQTSTQEFRDQFGHTHSLASQRGAAVTVVVVSVRRLAMIEAWERDLRERIPDARFLNIADLPAEVPVDLDRTAATLRKRVPAGVVVLMDPARLWATTYALDTTVPNLLIFDATGQLTAQFRGRWTAELGAQAAQALSAASPVPDGKN